MRVNPRMLIGLRPKLNFPYIENCRYSPKAWCARFRPAITS